MLAWYDWCLGLCCCWSDVTIESLVCTVIVRASVLSGTVVASSSDLFGPVSAAVVTPVPGSIERVCSTGSLSSVLCVMSASANTVSTVPSREECNLLRSSVVSTAGTGRRLSVVSRSCYHYPVEVGKCCNVGSKVAVGMSTAALVRVVVATTYCSGEYGERRASHASSSARTVDAVVHPVGCCPGCIKSVL